MGVIRERQFVLIFLSFHFHQKTWSLSQNPLHNCWEIANLVQEVGKLKATFFDEEKFKMDPCSLCYVIYHIQCEGKLREWNLMSLHFTHDSSNKVFPFHGKNSMMNFRCVLLHLRILSLDINACQHMFELLKIRDNSIFIGFYKAYVIFFLP